MTIRRLFVPFARIILAGAMLASLAVLPGCATNPATGKRQLMLMSEGQEVELGKSTDPEVIAEYGLYEDEALARYVDAVGQKIAAQSHRPDLEWHFRVVDSPVVNAFALPGGYLYVTRGILAYFNSEAELAAVLGHEIGHVTARHTAARYSKAQLMGVSLGLGMIFVPEFNQFSGLVQTGIGVLFLKFSRGDENQADSLGVGYAAKAGYDPEAAVEVFKMLEDVSTQSGRSPLPNWLSTHPAPENRQARVREASAGLGTGKGIVNREAYLEKIDGIVFGDDPNEGYMEGRTFIHPQMRFSIDFPEGWKVQNTKQYVLAVAPSEKAGLRLTLAGKNGDPEQLARQAAAKEGRSVVEGKRERIGGNAAYLAVFEVKDAQSGAVQRTLNAFIAFNDYVFRIEGLAQDALDVSVRDDFLDSMRSFRELRSTQGLDVTPERIRLFRVTQRNTLGDIIKRYSTGTAPPETVAVLNHMKLDTPVERGTIVKVVSRR